MAAGGGSAFRHLLKNCTTKPWLHRSPVSPYAPLSPGSVTSTSLQPHPWTWLGGPHRQAGRGCSPNSGCRLFHPWHPGSRIFCISTRVDSDMHTMVVFQAYPQSWPASTRSPLITPWREKIMKKQAKNVPRITRRAEKAGVPGMPFEALAKNPHNMAAFGRRCSLVKSRHR